LLLKPVASTTTSQTQVGSRAAATVQNELYTIVHLTAFFESLSGQLEGINGGSPYVWFGDGAVTRCTSEEYADVGSYRERFGKCKNKGWGCWSLLETRLRYLALIQEALLQLTIAGARDGDLGYLAAEARSAIKKYVRERSQFPWRMVAAGLDGTRQWMKTGEWTPTGKTYDQLRLEKTAAVIAEEGSIEHLTDCDLERKVSLKIFNRAAKTKRVCVCVCVCVCWRHEHVRD
jgi:hypothetical protein